MKGRKHLLLFCILLFSCCTSAFAQGEATRWYFGFNAGMNFNEMTGRSDVIINGTQQYLSGIPKYISGPIYTSEGCFSISDKDGNFLFSSDGRYVYNKENKKMPHGEGLKGHASATQSGIFIPRPGYPGRYYLVTAPASEQKGDNLDYGLWYYRIDMSEDGGKGDVQSPYDSNGYPIGTRLDFNGIYPDNDAFENIAAVGHSNGRDFWLVHRCRSRFFVWLVTSTGIHKNPTPGASFSYDIGYEPVPLREPGRVDGYHSHGYIKFSADGQYIACANPHQYNDERSSIVIGKFNITTGEITNIRNHIQHASDGFGYTAYGLAFSANNEYLYYACWWTGPLYRVSVKSLLDGTPETPYKVTDWVTNVQMGPDNRLYGITSSLRDTPWNDLFIVLDPDSPTPDVAVIPDYFPPKPAPKPGDTETIHSGSHLSFPTFVSSFFSASDIQTNPKLPVCMKNEITFSLTVNPGSGTNRVERLVWDFGDGSPRVADEDMDQFNFTKKHTYSKRGIYTVTVIPYRKISTDNYVAIENMVKTLNVRINSCVLPVNHNISVMGY